MLPRTGLPMPTQPAQIDEHLDDDGEVVSLGLNAFSDRAVTDEGTASEFDDSATSETETDVSSIADDAPLSGYDLVADMMRRQDEVLLKLDDLNGRIELAIAEISASRKSEIEAMEAENAKLEYAQAGLEDAQAGLENAPKPAKAA